MGDLYSGKIGLKIRKNDGIGPGAYEVQSFTDALQKENKGKFNMNKYQYNPSRLARHLPPSDNPSPSDYNPHSSESEKAPAGREHRFSHQHRGRGRITECHARDGRMSTDSRAISPRK